MRLIRVSTSIAFALVSFCLGELGDGLNIFQGIYLVGIGWNEGAIGIALSLMGFTALVCQTFAGDIIDKTTIDRRKILNTASILTACSAMTILFVQEGNSQHFLIYATKVIEGMASSFIGPCLAALTLANFGPEKFDQTMASNVLWGHIGSAISAILAGGIAFLLYPNIKSCFFVIGFSALCAILFIQFLPEGNPLLGRGFKSNVESSIHMTGRYDDKTDFILQEKENTVLSGPGEPKAATYLSVFLEKKILTLCATGFFFHFANANVLLVLGELMSSGNDGDDYYAHEDDNYYYTGMKRSAIPLIAGAILLAQGTMSLATILGSYFTDRGVGRKPLFLVGLASLPLRCALIMLWKDAGDAYLLSTQVLDGIGGGLFGLIHPFIVADISFGTGRFNVLMGLTASCFGFGATLSNFLGQNIVEKFGHMASLSCSLVMSFLPIIIFGIFMSETHNTRGDGHDIKTQKREYIQMI